MVWILGRTYCTGTPEDYKAAHAIMDKYLLVPLSAHGKPYTPPKGKADPKVDMKTPVRDQVNRLTATEYFKLLSALMKGNPPAKEDAPMVAKLAKIGIVPGKDFDTWQLGAKAAKALEGVPKAAQEKIMGHFKQAGKDINGWQFTIKTGLYGTDYLPCIRRPKWTATGSRSAARINTSCTSPRARRLRRRASGRSRCTTASTSSSTIR
jgi:hypothetical protein